MLQKARLLAYTLPHLKPWQVIGRVVARVKQRLGPPRLPAPPKSLENRLTPACPFPTHDPWNKRDHLLDGTFTFLNETATLGDPIDWKAPSMPLLWQFNLQYFHFLHVLSEEEQRRMCRAWLASNPPGTPVSWHPYPTSLRIVNWCRAGLQDPDLLNSLYLQAAYLYRNLETYIYGNHLLENARALVMAGRFFDGQGESSSWLEKGLMLYLEESKEQILPDGGHYERSPMYHALMLEGYLDVLNCLPQNHEAVPLLREITQHMVQFMEAFTGLDGRFPLFNDATEEIAMDPETLLEYARSLGLVSQSARYSFPESGYFIHKDTDFFVVIDGGAVGPEYLMAHAHADIFSYTLAYKRIPFVVDTGVFEYQAGTMRQYVRSTEAHNTVGIDGQDQVECWGSFRVARRARPKGVRFFQEGNAVRFEGSFSGYERLLGDKISHYRSITIDTEQNSFTVQDEVNGVGQHEVVSRVHLHPSVEIKELSDGLILEHAGITCQLRIDPKLEFQIKQGWYCPRFGEKIRNSVLEIGGLDKLPVQFAYTLVF